MWHFQTPHHGKDKAPKRQAQGSVSVSVSMNTSTSPLSVLCLNICLFVFLPTEVEFNVSEAFVPLATPNSNHSPHTGNEAESGTLERKRPASMAVMEGDLVKKERYVWWGGPS